MTPIMCRCGHALVDHQLHPPGLHPCFICSCQDWRELTPGSSEDPPERLSRPRRMIRDGDAHVQSCGWVTTTLPFKGLLLGRKFGEAFTIMTAGGERIRVVYASHKRSSIRLAIEAPPTCKILREELEPHDRSPPPA